jgi:hypothetical protein
MTEPTTLTPHASHASPATPASGPTKKQLVPLNNKDYEVFSQKGFDLDECLLSFQHDIGNFLNARWSQTYLVEINLIKECHPTQVLETFASSIRYGTWMSDAILDDLLTGCTDEEMDMLSLNTKKVFGHFFHMYFA